MGVGVGDLSLLIGHWSFVIGHLSLVIGHLSLLIRHWRLTFTIQLIPPQARYKSIISELE